MGNVGLSDCHLAEVMDDPEDIGGAKRPMCSFCGKKWPEILNSKTFNNGLELALRRWKDNELTTQEIYDYINSEYAVNFWEVTSKVRPHLQKRKRPMYEYNQHTMSWEQL